MFNLSYLPALITENIIELGKCAMYYLVTISMDI